IALSRVASQYPERVNRYEALLTQIAFDSELPHVIMRHFASTALLVCAAAGHTSLSKATLTKLKKVNDSPYPSAKSKRKSGDFYESRPDSVPEPEAAFHLDYEF